MDVCLAGRPRRGCRMPAIDLEPGRPAADECLPYYFEYIRLVPDGHVVERLAG